jgi:MFS family permease
VYSLARAYIVLANITPPERRSKMISLISFVWGFSRVLGPLLGRFIVNYFSWQKTFYIDIVFMGGFLCHRTPISTGDTIPSHGKCSKSPSGSGCPGGCVGFFGLIDCGRHVPVFQLQINGMIGARKF